MHTCTLGINQPCSSRATAVPILVTKVDTNYKTFYNWHCKSFEICPNVVDFSKQEAYKVRRDKAHFWRCTHTITCFTVALSTF